MGAVRHRRTLFLNSVDEGVSARNEIPPPTMPPIPIATSAGVPRPRRDRSPLIDPQCYAQPASDNPNEPGRDATIPVDEHRGRPLGLRGRSERGGVPTGRQPFRRDTCPRSRVHVHVVGTTNPLSYSASSVLYHADLSREPSAECPVCREIEFVTLRAADGASVHQGAAKAAAYRRRRPFDSKREGAGRRARVQATVEEETESAGAPME